jgi:hypothetical protein
MPDLRALMAAEAHRLGPDSIPAFDDLLARSRRRRAARATATVTGVVVAVAAVAVGGWWLSPRPSTRVAVSAPVTVAPSTAAAAPVSAPGVTTEVYARLRALAEALATNNGDPNPTRLEAVKVNPTRPAASRQPSPSSPPLTGGYFLEVQGHFLCGFCKGHAELRATVISQQVSDPGLAVVTTGFGGPWQDLTRYGTPFSLTSPTAALASASPGSLTTTAATTATTSPPPRPGPTTLAAAEQQALAVALHPAAARIAWALSTTVHALRAAGETFPAALPDATRMFVIAVHGDALTDGSLTATAQVVHRYGVMLRGDDSGDVMGNGVSFGDYFTNLEPPTVPKATVTRLSAVTTGFSGLTAASGAAVADAIQVQVAVAASGAKTGDQVQAALVQTNGVDGPNQLAWLVELNAGSSNKTTIWSQHLVDATTGEAFAMAVS